MRFVCGLLVSVALMVLRSSSSRTTLASFLAKIQPMFGFWLPIMAPESFTASGSSAGIRSIACRSSSPAWIIAGSLAIWPAQKNLGTLLSCSAAVMVAMQFWHAHGEGGGMYMAWFLPLTLLTIFRPNLEDRVALSVLGEDWFTRRRARLALHRAA